MPSSVPRSWVGARDADEKGVGVGGRPGWGASPHGQQRPWKEVAAMWAAGPPRAPGGRGSCAASRVVKEHVCISMCV